MADSSSSKAQEQMRALCRKISVAHDLDPEIQEELYGHMEDKLHAYLKGEEPLTEEDAFVLVREHFGDPAVLKGLLQDVHAQAVHVTLARRIAAAVVASTSLMILWTLLLSLVTGALIMFASEDGSFAGPQWVWPIASVLGMIGAAVLLWMVLRHWQRQLETDHRPWFLRRPPGSIVALIAVVLVLQKIVPFPDVNALITVESASAAPLFLVLGAVSYVLQCLAWLWWCDRPPRQTRALVYGFFAWLLTCVFWAVIPPLQLFISQGAVEPASGGFSYLSLAQGHVSGSSLHWQLRWSILPALGRVQVAAFAFIYAVGCGYVARILYGSAQRVRGRHTRPPADLSEVTDG
jgi:hypothetical protein